MGMVAIQSTDKLPDRILPEALQEYKPAHSWADCTVFWWDKLSKIQAPKPRVEVPAEEWSQIRDDMLRTTGNTPWTNVNPNGTLSLFFAGVWITPQLKVWTIEELRAQGVEIADIPKQIGNDG